MIGNMGQKIKYKFKVKNYSNLIEISEFDIKLIDDYMLMVR